jgi:hypothetical protein
MPKVPFPQVWRQRSVGPIRTEQVGGDGEKEGPVQIYSSMPQDDMAALTNEFEKRYG